VLQAISVYMIAALVLPDPKDDTVVDLRAHYFAHRHWFFAAVLGSVIFSLAKELVLYGFFIACTLDSDASVLWANTCSPKVIGN
jgi:hypothetical protein